MCQWKIRRQYLKQYISLRTSCAFIAINDSSLSRPHEHRSNLSCNLESERPARYFSCYGACGGIPRESPVFRQLAHPPRADTLTSSIRPWKRMVVVVNGTLPASFSGTRSLKNVRWKEKRASRIKATARRKAGSASMVRGWLQHHRISSGVTLGNLWVLKWKRERGNDQLYLVDSVTIRFVWTCDGNMH